MSEPETENQRIWFYDLNTKALFAGFSSDSVPTAAPSGELNNASAGTLAGVQALVMKVDGGEPNILLLMTVDDKDLTGTMMVKRPNDATWLSGNSLEGQKLFQEAQVTLSMGVQSFPE